MTPDPDLRQRVEQAALEYHRAQEGEYGCPGKSCPGVQRLVAFGLTCASLALPPRAQEPTK